MDFMSRTVFYLGIVDAALIMLFGIAIAIAFLLGAKDFRDKLMDRAFPALAIIVGASIAAALVLGAIRFLLGIQ